MTLCLRAVTRPGDTVAVESPTFYAALQALGDGAALKVERRLVLALQESKEARDPRRLGIAAAWSTSRTASSVLMNHLVMRGSVTVTGPPDAIWRWNVGMTLPRLPMTLP